MSFSWVAQWREERERDLIEESCEEGRFKASKAKEEKEREKGVWRRQREAESNKCLITDQVGLTFFNIFMKMLLSKKLVKHVFF